MDIEIPFNKKLISATVETPENWSKPKTCVILTHGAGGDKHFHQLVSLTKILVRNGYMCVRFTCKGLNIKYRIKVFVEVVHYVSNDFPHIENFVLGGRSMGSRAAIGAASCILSTRTVNKQSTKVSTNKSKSRKRKLETVHDNCQRCGAVHSNFTVKLLGVICLSYPLSPEGKEPRVDALKENAPISHLFVSGTEDEMCGLDLLKDTFKSMNQPEIQTPVSLTTDSPYLGIFEPAFPITLLLVKNAGHSLSVKGINDSELHDHVGKVILKWIGIIQTAAA